MLDLDHVESRFIPSLHSDADVLCIFHCSFFWLYSRDTQSFSRISFLIMFFFLCTQICKRQSRAV